MNRGENKQTWPDAKCARVCHPFKSNSLDGKIDANLSILNLHRYKLIGFWFHGDDTRLPRTELVRLLVGWSVVTSITHRHFRRPPWGICRTARCTVGWHGTKLTHSLHGHKSVSLELGSESVSERVKKRSAVEHTLVLYESISYTFYPSWINAGMNPGLPNKKLNKGYLSYTDPYGAKLLAGLENILYRLHESCSL